MALLAGLPAAACLNTTGLAPADAPPATDATRSPTCVAPAGDNAFRAFDGDTALDLDFCAEDGIVIDDDLVIEGEGFELVLRGTNGNQAIPRITSYLVRGAELLFQNDESQCQLENQAGFALFPAWAAGQPTSNAGSSLSIVGGGGGHLDVVATWQVEIPCTGAGTTPNVAGALVSGQNTYRVFRDGRVVRRDALSLSPRAIVEPPPESFVCDLELAAGCEAFAPFTGAVATSYWAFDDQPFDTIEFTVAEGVPNARGISPDDANDSVSPTYEAGGDIEPGWVCARGNDLVLGMTWRTGASNPYAAVGEGGRISHFPDREGGNVGAVAFEFDYFNAATPLPGRDEHSDNDADPNDDHLTAYRSTTMLWVRGEDADCLAIADAAAALDDPPQLTVVAAPFDAAAARQALGFSDDFAEYYWSQPDGAPAIFAAEADDVVPAGALLQLELEPHHAGLPRVYRDAPGQPPVLLEEGIDYVLSAPHGGPLGLEVSVQHAVYVLAPLAAGDALIVVGSGTADAPPDVIP